MAYQVAQAYDENKNLVPLYVLTDGEVPEVSPGFNVTATNYDNIIITAYSSNPTGGTVENVYERTSAGSIMYINDVNVINNSIFRLNVVVSINAKSVQSEIEANSTHTFSFNRLGVYGYSVDVSVQRIRS